MGWLILPKERHFPEKGETRHPSSCFLPEKGDTFNVLRSGIFWRNLGQSQPTPANLCKLTYPYDESHAGPDKFSA
jgi:hypothetical protein